MYYRSLCCDHNIKLADGGFSLDVDLNVVEQSIKDIFKDRKWSKETEKAFFAEVYKHYDKGVEKGFGKTFVDVLYNSPDFELLSNLKYNAASLAAFKNHNNSNDVLLALFDEDGKMRNFKDFKVAATSINEKYNNRWLKTEYDTAVAQANAASQWQEFENDKALYPNLKYIQIDRDTKNQAHVKWDGLILPIDHPFWNNHYPPNDWGCGCSVEQTDEAVKSKNINFKKVIDNKPGFNLNAGKEGKIVDDNHPYFKIEGFKDVAKNGLALYNNFKQNEYLPLLVKQWKDKAFTVGERKIVITEDGLKNSLNAKHKRSWLKNDLLLKLDEVMDNLTFVTETKVKQQSFYYYQLDGFDDMFIDVKFDKASEQYQLNSIGDSLDLLN